VKTDLRIAIESLCPGPGRVFGVAEAAAATGAKVTEHGARVYLRRLVGMRVLYETEFIDGTRAYTAGPQLQVWLALEPKTNLGGTRRTYLDQKSKSEAEAQAEWKERMRRLGIAFDKGTT